MAAKATECFEDRDGSRMPVPADVLNPVTGQAEKLN
jgi:hypothetical protein